MSNPIRVLILEDSAEYALLLVHQLRLAGYDPTYQRIETLEAMRTALTASTWDVILADFALASFSMPEALGLIHDLVLDLPFIVLYGNADEATAAGALLAEAHNLLVKGNWARLGPTIARELREAELRRQRRQAEDRLRLMDEILRRIQSLVVLTDATGAITFVSEAAHDILGYAPAELLSEQWWRLVYNDPAAAAVDREVVVRAARGEVLISSELYETSIKTRTGATRWLLWQAARGPSDTVIGIGHDITERKRSEAALRDSQARLASIFDTAAEAIISTDEQMQILLFNQAAEATFGYRSDEVLGQPVTMLFPPRFAEIHGQHMQTFANAADWAHSMGAGRVVIGRRKDGAEFPLQAGISKTVTEGALIFTFIGIDVTERQQAEQLLRASEQRYRSLFENMLNGFAYCQMFFDELQQPQDFMYLEVNRAFETLTGLTEVIGKRVTEVIPGIKASNPELFEIYGRVAMTGSPETFETHLEPLGHLWLSVAVYSPIRGFFVAIFDNITQRKQHEREMEAIAAVSAALRTAPTRAEMLPVILDQVLDLFHASGSALELFDRRGGEAVIEAARGAWAGIAERGIPPARGAVERVLATGRPYVSDDVETDPQLAIAASMPGIRSAVCVPLIAQGLTFGGLWAGRQTRFTADEIRLLTAVADIAANAIRRVTLHEQTERRLRKLTALRAIDMAISSSPDLRITLSVLVDQVMAQLQVDAADVLLFDAQAQSLVYTAGRGFRQEQVGQPSLPLGQGYAGRIVLDPRLVALPEGADEAPHADLLPSGEGFCAYYGVPLMGDDQVAGVLEVYHRSPLHPDSDWLEFLEALAGQAAIAIDNARLFADLQRSNFDLSQAYDATIEGWSRALDLRDKETEGHSQRVTGLTLQLAVALGMEAEQLVHMRRGALLHDIGKMGVPDRILLKPGPLNDEEWMLMRLHPKFAYDMLAPIEYLRPALDIPYWHHEKWDGTGYPQGLAGEQIPLAARIFAVVDVWDALTSDRPYRPAWPADMVRDHLRKLSGSHFDPQVVEPFLRLEISP